MASAPARATSSGPEQEGKGGEQLWEDDLASISETTDVELLKRAWRNEKAAPEVLPFQAPLVQRAREQIQLAVSAAFYYDILGKFHIREV